MANTGILIGWKRSMPGREGHALQKFGEYAGYLTKLQAEKHIESFEPVVIRPHGGNLDGFFLIRGERAKLGALRDTDHWKDWEAWGAYNMEGFAVLDCQLGDGLTDMLGRFGKLIGS
jgi:hypothetical protein